MTNCKKYKCVNCGECSEALYRTYGPSVLKLNKCEECKGTVDKYLEYDPVIVMIDLVLISKEAQRHVIYNTDFKSYWKLFIIFVLLETYGMWRNDSLFNIIVNTVCDIKTNATVNTTHLDIPFNINVPEQWKAQCDGWILEQKMDDTDLFIWEKDFYIQFVSSFIGIIVFILAVHVIMKCIRLYSPHNNVSLKQMLKAFSLANVSILFTLPMLVWGNTDTSAETRTVHYLLVFQYSFAMFTSVFTVVYECGAPAAALALAAAHCARALTILHTTPRLRQLVTLQ